MDIKTISFSQNKGKERNNSLQIAEMVGEVTEKEVTHINIRDYHIVPCELCGKCVKSHTCEIDESYEQLLKDIGHPDLIFLVVPYYSPYPSTLMIFLEKLNEIFYSAWMKDPEYAHPLQGTKVGLIVHGGLVDGDKVQSHYKTMMSRALSNTLKGLGFMVIEDDKDFQHGYAFGIENESCIKGVKKEVFPLVNHRDDYVKDKVKGYTQFVINSM